MKKTPRCRNQKKRPPLYFKVFLVAVVLPGLILSLIALRTITHENAYIEKRLKDNLSIELTYAVSVTETILRQLHRELDSIAAQTQHLSTDANDATPDIVNLPFQLSNKRDIISPVFRSGLSQTGLDFLKYNEAFFQDRLPIPVYTNIAVVFADDIKSHSSSKVSSSAVDKDAGGKMALSQLKQDKEALNQIYEQVKSSGKQIAQRSIKVKEPLSKNPSSETPSEYVTESLHFSEIIADKNSGIIPRVVDGYMMLLYWRKTENQQIAGCVINDTILKQRLMYALPPVYTGVRVLTLVDQRGQPIISVSEEDAINWKAPFVASEVNELLPGWEAVAYLRDPQSITHRAQLTALLIGGMVVFLLLSLVVGSIIIFRAINSQLLLAQQKTTFVANVSHELKTPLTSIRLFAEILKEQRQPDPAKQRKYLSIMVSEIERLTRLINNVLDFSRSSNGKKTYAWKVVDCAGLVPELVESQRDRLEHNGFSLCIEVPGEPLLVKGDEEALKQTLINLLSNAEKYSADTKAITIRVRHEGNWAVIEVQDRGIGIKSSDIPRIFEEFYRVDDSLTANVGGSGLGLTISRRIVEDHGGTITCCRAEPKGTIFSIRIPLNDGA